MSNQMFAEHATRIPKFRVLGIELLGQECESALNTISADSRGSVVACCSGIFSLWLERQPEASWRQLIDALTNVKLVSLAVEIKRLLTPPELQKVLKKY